MMGADLQALADRCEQAAGADRLLDNLIWVALEPGGSWIIGAEPGRFPQKPIYGTRADLLEWLNGENGHGLDTALPSERYTASLDIAMTLVPEGFSCGAGTTFYDRKGWAYCVPYGASGFQNRDAATPALALCAAALRARQALSPEGASK